MQCIPDLIVSRTMSPLHNRITKRVTARTVAEPEVGVRPWFQLWKSSTGAPSARCVTRVLFAGERTDLRSDYAALGSWTGPFNPQCPSVSREDPSAESARRQRRWSNRSRPSAGGRGCGAAAGGSGGCPVFSGICKEMSSKFVQTGEPYPQLLDFTVGRLARFR